MSKVSRITGLSHSTEGRIVRASILPTTMVIDEGGKPWVRHMDLGARYGRLPPDISG